MNLSYHRIEIQRTVLGVSSYTTRLGRGGFSTINPTHKKRGERTGRKGREGMQAGPSQSYSIETDESKCAYG